MLLLDDLDRGKMEFIDIYNENHKYLGTCEKKLAHKNCKWTLTEKNDIERDKKYWKYLQNYQWIK